MAGKRKAGNDNNGTRHPAARRRRGPTAGDDLAGTSANNAGPTANAAGDGIAGTSPEMAWLLAVTSGYAGASSQFGGAARGAGGGSGYRGLSQSHGRAPQMPSQGMLRPLLGNPAGGRPPSTGYQYHTPTGHGSLPGQNQIAGPLQTGTGQPRGHSGSDGPSSAISSASAPSAPVIPHARDCYNNFGTSNVLPQHPEIRYVSPPPRPVPSYGGATQGQGIAIGHQRQVDHRLRQPSSAAPARVAVGPHTWGPCARWCRLCPAPATRVYCSAPFCEVCYNRLFVTDDVPPQHVLPSPVPSHAGAPRGAVPAGEQQYRAAAIRPPSSSSSSSAVGSGPICQACGHLTRTRNRACRSCHHGGPPPPGLG